MNAGLKYAYRMYEMTEDPERDWLLAMSVDNPQGTRVGMMVPIETNKWQVRLPETLPYFHVPLVHATIVAAAAAAFTLAIG